MSPASARCLKAVQLGKDNLLEENGHRKYANLSERDVKANPQ